MIRRARLMVLGTFTYLTCLTSLTCLIDLTDFALVRSVDGVSATCTAPPASKAPPAATADNFARAIRTDMGVLSFPWREVHRPRKRLWYFPSMPSTRWRVTRAIALTLIRTVRRRFFGHPHCHQGKLSQSGTEIAEIPKDSLTPPGQKPAQSWSNSPVCWPLGGESPRCCQPRSLRQRPRAVRAIRPSWMR